MSDIPRLEKPTRKRYQPVGNGNGAFVAHLGFGDYLKTAGRTHGGLTRCQVTWRRRRTALEECGRRRGEHG